MAAHANEDLPSVTVRGLRKVYGDFEAIRRFAAEAVDEEGSSSPLRLFRRSPREVLR